MPTIRRTFSYPPEYILSRQVSEYLRWQYPHVIFHYDLSGLNHSKAQAGMAKAIQCVKGWPDLFIAAPRGEYHGLFIELKAEGVKLHKSDDITFASAHVEEQFRTIVRLRNMGYKAMFCIGFEDTKKWIDEYLKS